jgi:hypothetical protein
MRLSLRKAAFLSAAGSLIFYCSCERHRVDELPGETHTKAAAEEHGSTSHASPSPAAHSTPANFFPDKQKP